MFGPSPFQVSENLNMMQDDDAMTSKAKLGLWQLFEEFVKIYPVDDVARSINCLRPEARRRLVFIKHSAGHLNKSPVLALHDAILLMV